MIKNYLCLSFLCLLFAHEVKAQEAYAVYDDGTLTFYYDDLKDSRDGTTYYLNVGSNDPRWLEYSDDITRVVFNRSFSQARPTSTNCWFYQMYNLETIEGIGYLDTSEVTDMCWMFWNCASLTSLDVSNFDTSNVEYMSGLFGCYNRESILTSLDVSGFDTRKVKEMYAMFQNCSQLTSLDVSHFNTSNVIDMNWMFYNCNSLTSLNVSSFNTSKVTAMKSMFSDCSNLTSLDVSNFNTSKVTDMEGVFSGCSSLTTIDVGSFNTSNVTDMSWLFSYCSSLTNIDVSNFNTSKVTDMEGMFCGCSSLTTLDVGSFNTSNVTNMSIMFESCSKLKSIEVSNFDTSNCKNMRGMFSFMSSLLTLDLSNFDTSKVKSMESMFLYCFDLKQLNVNSFDTSNVTNMHGMFNCCQSLSHLNISNFNTSVVTDMSSMFDGCRSLSNIDLVHFDTSNVKTMEWMFSYSGIEFLDLTNFDTSNLSNMSYMFYNSDYLSTIYVGELWNLEKVTAADCIFDLCRSLVGGMGTQYEEDHSDISYAHIDEGPSNPGYLTTYSDCAFPDLQKTNDYYGATCYLYRLGIISGSDTNGKMDAEEPLKRSHLAKIAFRGLYSIKGRTVPSSVISDNFPTVYDDLAERTINNDYYYQAAKALLYLEYGDGITPFDRNRLMFEPEEKISRVNALKVLMETFNIKPDLEGTNNPFPEDENVVRIASSNPLKMGYIRKAAALGIITTVNSEFRPYDNCLRGEAFVMLTRILRKVVSYGIKDPNPQESDYFQPLNITLKTISIGVGLQLGNFQHYTKTSFAMNGVIPLTFSHSYNSYSTTLPSVFYGDKSTDADNSYKPLGDGWSHTYHSFLTIVGNLSTNDVRLIAHWGGGSIDVYKSNGSELIPESMGVYDKCQLEGSEVVITTKQQVKYRFAAQSGSDAQVLYLKTVASLTFTYLNGTDYLEKVIDPLGREIQFSYFDNIQTGKKQLHSFTDAEGNTTTYEYADLTKMGTSKLLSRIRLPKGNYIENEYDANCRLSQTITGQNGVPATQTNITVSATYDNAVTTTSQVDVTRGSVVSHYNYIYNENNVVTNMTGADNLYVNSTYGNDRHPQLPTSVQDNNTNVSSITYDDNGNITEVTVTGDGTQKTRMAYDSKNNLLSITDPNGNTTEYDYNENGNLIQVSAPEGVNTYITVRPDGLPSEIRNAMNVVTELDYNSYGNLNKVTLPSLGLSSGANYDAASRITSTTDAMERVYTYEYDNNDNLKTETDPAEHSTIFDYDANGNLTGITNAKGGVTSLSYDNATDWLTSVSFAGCSKRYAYNNDGTLSTYTKPDGTSLNYSYDDLGRITSDGVNSYSYDDKLRLSSISGNGKTLSFTYDGFNRITGTSCNGHSNTYAYDDNGNCIGINDIQYTYDGLNRLKTVNFWGKTITYNYRKDSKLSSVSYPNGMTTSYDYDSAGRLTGKTTSLSSGTTIASYGYVLDNVGNILSQTTQEPYDDMYLENQETDYTYNSDNHIQYAGDIAYELDKNGNTTKRGTETYNWNSQDRLTRAGATDIEYDPLGLISSYGDITFTTDPLSIGNVLSDSKSGAEYIYGNGLEARLKNGTTSYYVTDVRGSVVAIVDEHGNITHKYQYDEFGNVVQKQEADYNPFQYVGKHGIIYLNDHLYYMRARHYDPTIGRFLSEDPIWSTNLYPYADNNPIMGIDPSGRIPLVEGVNATKEAIVNYLPEAKEFAIEIYESSMPVINDAITEFGGMVAELKMEIGTAMETLAEPASEIAPELLAGGGSAMGIGGSVGLTAGIGAGGLVVVGGSAYGAYELGQNDKKGWAYGVGAGGGAVGGCALGAAAGSFVPVIGTGIGCLAGGVIGAGVGAISAYAGTKNQ